MSNWMIYGANGYTGALIAKEAAKRGLSPILAGRNAQALEALAKPYGFAYRVFDLNDVAVITANIKDMALVLHCAGPFSATGAPMIEACLAAGTHYLDISGEISLFEHAQQQSARAAKANIVICPGVGFDVIPTDCVAAALKAALPDATELVMGFDSDSKFSPGTAKTSVEGLGRGGMIRRNGKLTIVPLAYETRRIDFGRGEKLGTTIPWGDVSTAFYTTGIPNIKVFIAASPDRVKTFKRLNWIRWALRLTVVRKLVQHQVGKRVVGPDEATRERIKNYLWGEVTNQKGEKKTARIQTNNGYTLTIDGSLAVVEWLLVNKVEGKAYTPSVLLGAGLVERLPGSSKLVIT
jgi:short subunit dehydrogenase-like uncharacterized protein